MGFKVVKPGDVIDFFGCQAKVVKVTERGTKANEKTIRFVCLDKAAIKKCSGKGQGFFANAFKGSSLHPNEKAQLNSGKSGCYSNWKDLAAQAFSKLSDHCAKLTGTKIVIGLSCMQGPAMANRCCAGSNTIDECERRRKAGAA